MILKLIYSNKEIADIVYLNLNNIDKWYFETMFGKEQFVIDDFGDTKIYKKEDISNFEDVKRDCESYYEYWYTKTNPLQIFKAQKFKEMDDTIKRYEAEKIIAPQKIFISSHFGKELAEKCLKDMKELENCRKCIYWLNRRDKCKMGFREVIDYPSTVSIEEMTCSMFKSNGKGIE